MEKFEFGRGTELSAKSFSGDRQFVVVVDSSTPFSEGGSAKLFTGTTKPPESNAHDGAVTDTVALKFFKTNLASYQEQMIRRELRAARVAHRYILPYIGTTTFHLTMILISPYMKNGNLLQYLARDPTRDWRPLVATAVEFLHSNCKMVHGDLKCENVLVSNDGQALLFDFGLCTYIDKTDKHTATATELRGQNTFRYAAPELLFGTGDGDQPERKTAETDVYAFGMTIIQACTRQHPWPNCTHHRVLMKISNREEHPRPSPTDSYARNLTDPWWELVLDCCSHEPTARPTMTRALSRLATFDADITAASSPDPSHQSPLEVSPSTSSHLPATVPSDKTSLSLTVTRDPGASRIPPQERTQATSERTLNNRETASSNLQHWPDAGWGDTSTASTAVPGCVCPGTERGWGDSLPQFALTTTSPTSTSTELTTQHASIHANGISSISKNYNDGNLFATREDDPERTQDAWRPWRGAFRLSREGRMDMLTFEQQTPSYGDVSKRPGFREIDNFLRLAVRAAEKALLDVPPPQRNWMAVQRAFQLCPSLTASPEHVIERCDGFIIQFKYWFDMRAHRYEVQEQIRRWFTRLTQDCDLVDARADTDLEAIHASVAHATRILNGSVIFNNQRHQRTLLDIGVLRYPDIHQPYIKVYRIELTPYYETGFVMGHAHAKNGIMAQFNLRQYQPHEESIDALRGRMKQLAIL